MEFSSIKNLIFDLGGVVIDIDFELTFSAFATLSGKSIKEVKIIMDKMNIWDSYERGELSDIEFVEKMKEAFNFSRSSDEIIEAWNALLLELPKERIDLVNELNKRYNTYVLSNTSNLHVIGVNSILKKSTGYANLKDVFGKVYYSYEINRRKPELGIYEYVLTESKLNPSETVFLDDNLDNVMAARQVGLHAIHVEVPETILHYLKDA